MVIIFRVIILYVFVILAMRIMGKRQIGELQPYELVTAIILSELAAMPMQDTAIPLLHSIIPIIGLVILEVLSSYLALKSQRFSKTPITKEDLNIKGKDPVLPISIILDGKINYKNLQIAGYDENWINKILKNRNIKNPNDIFVAILDSTGELFIQKRGEENETKN